jgi:hypothetical protein
MRSGNTCSMCCLTTIKSQPPVLPAFATRVHATSQVQVDRIDSAAEEAKREFSAAVDARSSELKQQLHRGASNHTRDIVEALQQQATLLAAAEAAAVSLDAAFAGSTAAHALFDICTRASCALPAIVPAEFQRSPTLSTSAPLLGQLHASRRAVWNSGAAAGSNAESLHPSKPLADRLRPADHGDPAPLPHRSAEGGAAVLAAGCILSSSLASTCAAAADTRSSVSAGAAAQPEFPFFCSIGMKGCGDGQFDAPWGVAVDGEGSILVTEKNGNRLQVLQRDGDSGAWMFAMKPGLKAPRGVASVKGMVVIAHTESHELLLKPEMSLIGTKKEWIHLGSGLLNNPNGVDIDSDLNVWVADTGNR